jgi:glycopeptide antibiotics resistance protein
MDVKKRKILALTLFGIYCILLLWVILFKLMPPFEGVAYLRGIRSISWIPFDFDTNPHHHFLEVMLNFLAFVPFGLLLKQAFIKWWKIIIMAFSFSLFCEITQYILMIGVTDVTDLITNTMGAVLGVLIFIAIRKLKLVNKKTG